MTKISDSFASILGVVAACLLSIATASTCSVAMADAPPSPAVAAPCTYDTMDFTCTYDSNCAGATPTCWYTDITRTACVCRVKPN